MYVWVHMYVCHPLINPSATGPSLALGGVVTEVKEEEEGR